MRENIGNHTNDILFSRIKVLERQKEELIETLHKCLLSSDPYNVVECNEVLKKYTSK
jgi:hypothetical protein